MANRLTKLAASISGGPGSLFVPYMTAGYPDTETSLSVFRTLIESGADVLEIGIPFSDPLADGPAIQKASTVALEAGMTLDGVFEIADTLRTETEIPFVLMGYYNPVFKRGTERFIGECVDRGVDGLIIPDLLPDEADEFTALAHSNSISTIYLAAPNTPEERLKLIAEKSNDFIYCVSRYGVTGVSDSLPNDLTDYLDRVRRTTGRKILVGFGVGTPEAARTLAPHADGVVVGSAIIKLVSQGGPEMLTNVKSFALSIKEAASAEEVTNG